MHHLREMLGQGGIPVHKDGRKRSGRDIARSGSEPDNVGIRDIPSRTGQGAAEGRGVQVAVPTFRHSDAGPLDTLLHYILTVHPYHQPGTVLRRIGLHLRFSDCRQCFCGWQPGTAGLLPYLQNHKGAAS